MKSKKINIEVKNNIIESIDLEGVKKEILDRKKKEDKAQKEKEKRALGFRISIEFLNILFDLMKKRKYKLIPKDAKILRIGSTDMMYNCYMVLVTSKKFPIVPEGSACFTGCIEVDKKKGIIEIKEIK